MGCWRYRFARIFSLFGNENLEGLYCQSHTLAVALLKCFLESPEEFWNNTFPQVHQEGDYWSKPRPEEIIVDYSKDLQTINRHLRAHRFVFLDGSIEFISGVSSWIQEHNFDPGTILLRNGSTCLAAAADGLVCFTLETKAPPKYTIIS